MPALRGLSPLLPQQAPAIACLYPGIERAPIPWLTRYSVKSGIAHSRRLFGASWPDEAKRIVAKFRATHDLWAGDPAFIDLLARVRQGCPEFSTWWEAHDVGGTGTGEKVFRHPKRGLLRFEYASFQVTDDPALKLVIYTAV